MATGRLSNSPCTRAAIASCGECLDAVGHPVIDLVRTQVGPLQLAGVKPGRLRELTNTEVRALYAAAG